MEASLCSSISFWSSKDQISIWAAKYLAEKFCCWLDYRDVWYLLLSIQLIKSVDKHNVFIYK